MLHSTNKLEFGATREIFYLLILDITIGLPPPPLQIGK